MSLFRPKRDFGISAIIVGIVAVAAVGATATASALALSNTVQTARAVNNLSASITMALDKQASANTQIQGGLMLVNQRIDLVQEQLDILWQMAQLGCEQKLPGLCVTSIQYEKFSRAANLSKSLSQFILQNWSSEFEQTLRELRVAIVQINSTRLDLSLTEGLSTWISSAVSYLKEWAGMGTLGILMAVGFGGSLWLICQMRASRKRERTILTQALMAIEDGQSPTIWLAALNEQKF